MRIGRPAIRRDDAIPSHDEPTAFNGTFSYNSSGRIAAFQRETPRAQDFACRFALSAQASRDRHTKESNAQPGGTTLYRECAQGCNAIGKEQMIELGAAPCFVRRHGAAAADPIKTSNRDTTPLPNRFCSREPHHLCPPLGFFSNQPAEIGRYRLAEAPPPCPPP